MDERIQANTAALDAELDWLAQLIDLRLRRHFEVADPAVGEAGTGEAAEPRDPMDPMDLPPPGFSEDRPS
ncbi:MAG: hypothetical protein KC457_32370, partial [Myxococcales bacterium]|nr:hypothetical protein [Myxococcales bacterium]